MSTRDVEVSLADPGVPADTDAFESAEAGVVPVQEERVDQPLAAPAAQAPAALSHAAPQHAAQVQATQAQVQAIIATTTYDETAEVRRANDEQLQEVHAQAEADEQRARDEQKHEGEEQARTEEEAHQREEHEREEQEQKDRDAEDAADHAALAATDAPAHEE